jgi:pimeloyl-ACP methyl ester carboxylesterase
VRLESEKIRVDDLRLHYLAAGAGPPVLLLHGWPTSSFLWRNVMPRLAAHRRAIALDLPGFGRSDKPLDRTYDFAFYRRAIDGFLAALGIERLGLVVHDMGGPIGLSWASQNPERVERLALLNTLVYPELSFAARAFLLACRIPVLRSALTSRQGLKGALYVGVTDPGRLRGDAVAGLCEPFTTPAAREALRRTGADLDPRELAAVARWLPTLRAPVRVVYGTRDRILPDIRDTVRRLQRDVPSAEITALEDCGHFLQEERPEELGELLAAFFRDPRPGGE